MTYNQLTEKSKENAVINYCYIMGIDLEKNREHIIHWFKTRNVDTLDINGRFTSSIKSNIAGNE